jgi:hypothetical protein
MALRALTHSQRSRIARRIGYAEGMNEKPPERLTGRECASAAMIVTGGILIFVYMNFGRWIFDNLPGAMDVLWAIGCWSLIGAGILNQIKRPILGAVLGLIPGVLFAAYTCPIPC